MAEAGAGAASSRFEVLVLNQVAARGLARLPVARYHAGPDVARPDAILLRSADLHARSVPDSVLAVARAGAGTNNIPVAALATRGVPVFNTPGANANAVKELVLAAMLMSARRLAPALRFVQSLELDDAAMEQAVEDGKKSYAGFELAGHALGIVGLGKVGCLVADAAIKLGMTVWGHDPHITIDAAWSLPAQVRRAASVDDVLRRSDFVTLHVPLVETTRGLVGPTNLPLLRPGATLLNFSRAGVVDDAAVLQALGAGRLATYACDFPSAALNAHPGVLAFPHLGASTAEAEENCAVMAVDQLRDYLEHGTITHAVNFPTVEMARESAWRVGIANANVPSMLGRISNAFAAGGLNIRNMVNKSRGELAYTLVDVDSPVDDALAASLRAIDGVLAVRRLPDAGA